MQTRDRCWRRLRAAGRLSTLLVGALLLLTVAARSSAASIFPWHWFGGGDSHGCGPAGCVVGDLELTGEPGGTWHWVRSPDEEKRVITGLYTRYCVRCHGVDGRGIWDIPDVPDFTNARWQACRSDAQLARAILEGRGAVMPPFRGTMTLEEAWAMARYLRTFLPGTEASRPDVGGSEKDKSEKGKSEKLPAPRKVKEASK